LHTQFSGQSSPTSKKEEFSGHPFTLKSILRQKKKNFFGSSNISPCQNIIFQKTILYKKPTKILQDIIVTLL
jgi:hypothetical protein